jgi:hypothetical protein
MADPPCDRCAFEPNCPARIAWESRGAVQEPLRHGTAGDPACSGYRYRRWPHRSAVPLASWQGERSRVGLFGRPEGDKAERERAERRHR